MGAGATMYRFQIELSDVDRGVYASLDLRLARHPSETHRYLLARTLAYCLAYEEGIAFSRGLSTADEPALWVKSLEGVTTAWIEIGTPSAERLHKARKACPRVLVFTHHAPALLLRETAGKGIHRAAEIEVYSLEPAFLDAMAEEVERNARWDLCRTDGRLYVTVAGKSFETQLARHTLDP